MQLTDDGTRIAWDRLRPDTREKLRRVLADPDVAKQLGTPAAATDNAVGDPLIIGVLYDAVSSIMVSIARASGYPVDRAAVLRFNAEEKQLLAAPTAAVLAKYSGFLGAYQEEAALAMLLTALIGAKVTLLRTDSGTVAPFPAAVPQTQN